MTTSTMSSDLSSRATTPENIPIGHEEDQSTAAETRTYSATSPSPSPSPSPSHSPSARPVESSTAKSGAKNSLSPLITPLPEPVASFFSSVSLGGFPQPEEKVQPWRRVWKGPQEQPDGKLIVACPKKCDYGTLQYFLLGTMSLLRKHFRMGSAT